jgi:hypothetical protein
LPLQHPLLHELGVHTHCPVLVLHPSPEAHDPHIAPPIPQDVLDSDPYASQVPVAPPLQQPPGHVFASHVQLPAVVSQRPLLHDPQAAPTVPHCVGDSDA